MATPKSISTIKSFAVLRAFRHRGETLTNAQLSRRTGLPASSVRRLLLTLSEIGAVERAAPASYRLGPLLHSLGRSAHVLDCLLGAARAPLGDLHRRLGLPVTLAVLDGHMTHYLDVLARDSACHVEKDARYESYSSASGRILLASLSSQQIDKFLADGELIALTPFTVTASGRFRAELEKVRCQGFAVECEETRIGLGCVAGPIKDDYGRTLAAICVSDEAFKLKASRIQTLVGEIAKVSSEVRRSLFPVADAISNAGRRAPASPLADAAPLAHVRWGTAAE